MTVPDALVVCWTLCLLTKAQSEIRFDLPCAGAESRYPFFHRNPCRCSKEGINADMRDTVLTSAGLIPFEMPNAASSG